MKKTSLLILLLFASVLLVPFFASSASTSTETESLSYTVNSNPGINDHGLILYMPANNNVNDYSGNLNNAVIHQNSTYPFVLANSTSCLYSECIQSNGGYAAINISSTLEPSSQLTVSAWLYSSGCSFYCFAVSAQQASNWAFDFGRDGQWYAEIQTTNSSGTSSQHVQGTPNVVSGAKQCQTNNFPWNGYIDEVRAYNITESASWEKSMYQATVLEPYVTFQLNDTMYTQVINGNPQTLVRDYGTEFNVSYSLPTINNYSSATLVTSPLYLNYGSGSYNVAYVSIQSTGSSGVLNTGHPAYYSQTTTTQTTTPVMSKYSAVSLYTILVIGVVSVSAMIYLGTKKRDYGSGFRTG